MAAPGRCANWEAFFLSPQREAHAAYGEPDHNKPLNDVSPLIRAHSWKKSRKLVNMKMYRVCILLWMCVVHSLQPTVSGAEDNSNLNF